NRARLREASLLDVRLKRQSVQREDATTQQVRVLMALDAEAPHGHPLDPTVREAHPVTHPDLLPVVGQRVVRVKRGSGARTPRPLPQLTVNLEGGDAAHDGPARAGNLPTHDGDAPVDALTAVVHVRLDHDLSGA